MKRVSIFLLTIFYLLFFGITIFLFLTNGNSNFNILNDDPPAVSNRIDGITSGAMSNTSFVNVFNNKTNKQELYTWGTNEKGNMGTRSDYDAIKGSDHPRIITNGGYYVVEGWKVVQIENNNNFTIVLLHSDEKNKSTIYSFGDNSSGQLGQSNSRDHDQTPRHIYFFDDRNVTQVFTGYKSAGAVTKDEQGVEHIWTWGANDYGQLGQGTTDNNKHSTPHEISFELKPGMHVKKIASGGKSTFAIIHDDIMKKDYVYSWGSNSKGKLGIGVEDEIISNPQYNDKINENIINDISVGTDYTLMADNNGGTDFLYGWGSNAYGQLGINSTKTDYNIPTRSSLGVNGKILQVNAGNKSSAVIVEEPSGNTLYTAGLNDEGQLGLDYVDDGGIKQTLFQKVTFQNNLYPIEVQMSEATTTLLLSDGKNNFVYTTGKNDKGQLGTRSPEPNSGGTFKSLNNISSFNSLNVQSTTYNSVTLRINISFFEDGGTVDKGGELLPYRLNLFDSDGKIVGVSEARDNDERINIVTIGNLSHNTLYTGSSLGIEGRYDETLRTPKFSFQTEKKSLLPIIIFSIIGLVSIISLILIFVIVGSLIKNRSGRSSYYEEEY